MEATSTETVKRRSFRISLRTALVVATLVCVFLGWKVHRNRQAAAIISRHLAILDQMELNLSRPPVRAAFVMPVSVRQKTAAFRQKIRSNPVHHQFGYSGWLADRFDHMTDDGELLDVSAALATLTDSDLATQLRGHYEEGFGGLGLRRNATINGNSARSIWVSTDGCVQMIVDVDVDDSEKNARVRLLYLHHEALELW